MQYEAKYDLNNDGIIDQKDIDIFLQYFGTYVNPNDPVSKRCDFDGNRVIDEYDYSALIAHFGTSGEPKTGLFPKIVVGGLILLVFLGIAKLAKGKR